MQMDIANFSRVSVRALVRKVPHTCKFRYTLLKTAVIFWEVSYLIHFVMFSHAFQ